MTFVLQLADDPHYRLSGDMIRSLHFMMTEHDLAARPGLWRPGPIWVRSGASSEVVYEGPDSGDVPALVDALIARLDAERQVPPIVRAAMAHLNLVLIHPFSDGNGRMARALQTLILVRETGSVAEFASIEEYLGRNTRAYYDILARVGGGTWSPAADARPWARFCLEAHFVQASSVLRRVQESEGIWQQLDELVTDAGLPPRTVHALFDATIGLRVRNASYRAALEHGGDTIAADTAGADLRRMVAAGLLTMVGERRWARYVATDRLTEIRERSQSNREPIDASNLFTPTGQLRLDG